jgi:SAM-dependent methyltransferase/uncharacterized protein YbaR (Trm112 family)
MNIPLKIDAVTMAALRCPACVSGLAAAGDQFQCTGSACGRAYPVLDGRPVLINEAASVFRIEEVVAKAAKGRENENPARAPGLRQRLARILLPRLGRNVKAAQNYRKFAGLLATARPAARVLVIGSGEVGQGLDAILGNPALTLVETDVTPGGRTVLVCDAHDLPFADQTFDGVIIQAVLEHVVEPTRCVAEMWRVLKPGGLVYAETPFMQQVHGGAHDFLRFSHLGHRRLFRHFTEVESGAACGPGMALAWAYKYFLTSFFTERTPRLIRWPVTVFAHLTSFWLKYLDPLLIDKPGALDAASGYYFMGARSEQPISDREIIGSYRGCH